MHYILGQDEGQQAADPASEQNGAIEAAFSEWMGLKLPRKTTKDIRIWQDARRAIAAKYEISPTDLLKRYRQEFDSAMEQSAAFTALTTAPSETGEVRISSGEQASAISDTIAEIQERKNAGEPVDAGTINEITRRQVEKHFGMSMIFLPNSKSNGKGLLLVAIGIVALVLTMR